MARSERAQNLGLLFFSTLLSAGGQLLFKYAFDNSAWLVAGIAAGLVAYVLSTMIYFTVLSRVHLSWAYGIGGLSYVFATIFAAFILFENIPIVRWIGVGVIFLGVILIGLS